VVTQHLVALIPPGNIIKEAASIQAWCFADTGSLSSQALPPLLPLVWTREDTPESIVDSLPQTELEPLEPGAPRRETTGALLPVSLTGGWTTWIGTLAPWRVEPDVCFASLVPACGSGLFLCGDDGPADLSRVQWKPCRIRVFLAALIEIAVNNLEEPWAWIDWHALWSRRIKLRG
jgi:hypothetical protein